MGLPAKLPSTSAFVFLLFSSLEGNGRKSVFSPSMCLLLTNELLLLYVQLQAGGIIMDVFKALCSFLRCWSCCWLYAEETCSSLGLQASQKIEG